MSVLLLKKIIIGIVIAGIVIVGLVLGALQGKGKMQGDGSSKSYYPDGRLQEVGTIKSGKFNGTFKSYYPSGHLKLICNYKEGNKGRAEIYRAVLQGKRVE